MEKTKLTGLDIAFIESRNRDLDRLMEHARDFGESRMGIFRSDFDGHDDEFDIEICERILLMLKNRVLERRHPGWRIDDLEGCSWRYRTETCPRTLACVTESVLGNGKPLYIVKMFDPVDIFLSGSLEEAMGEAEHLLAYHGIIE